MENGKRGISRKQAAAIEFFLNDKHQSKARALRMAGYGESVARQPHKVFGSSAVIVELERYGYDQIGIRIEPQAKVAEIETAHVSPPEYDLSRIPLETLQILKQKLAEISSPTLKNEPLKTYSQPVVTKYSSGSTWPSSM